ncbi:MAG: cupin domain-containing protein [Polyangiaceae bacterium]|nr:cupin domain-containing protein [Polyangiaceae bacterium]
MSTPRRAVPATELPAIRGSLYPKIFADRMGDREKRRLGEAFGLTQYGVNLVTLGPGGQSALRHWHTREDELIYVLSGELVLITGAGEQVVRAGAVVGFPGGDRDAHHFVNRSAEPAQYLEIGSRIEEDVAHYPDDDLMWVKEGGQWLPAHKDGTRY